MGYIHVSGVTKQHIIDSILRADNSPDFTFENLDHSLRGSSLWILTKVTNKKTGESVNRIQLFRINRSGDGWGYKGFTEKEHPYYYDCPKKFLHKSECMNSEWRSKVLQWHSQNGNSRKFEVGQVYRLTNTHKNWMKAHGDKAVVIQSRPLLMKTSITNETVKPKRSQIGELVS